MCGMDEQKVLWSTGGFDDFVSAIPEFVMRCAPRGLRVLVCGDRLWSDRAVIESWLFELPKGSEIVHGAAHGADRLAGSAARMLGFSVVERPAQWERFGKAAGPLRNREMLDLLPDFVLAFHADLGKSKGTLDTVTEARRRGIQVYVVSGA
jgi:hypothetical protein